MNKVIELRSLIEEMLQDHTINLIARTVALAFTPAQLRALISELQTLV